MTYVVRLYTKNDDPAFQKSERFKGFFYNEEFFHTRKAAEAYAQKILRLGYLVEISKEN